MRRLMFLRSARATLLPLLSSAALTRQGHFCRLELVEVAHDLAHAPERSEAVRVVGRADHFFEINQQIL